MSAIPAFEIGVWNVWILPLLVFVSMFIPNLFLGEEGKKRNKRLQGFVTTNRTKKVLVWSTHLVIWPLIILYSIFLPLKLGTACYCWGSHRGAKPLLKQASPSPYRSAQLAIKLVIDI